MHSQLERQHPQGDKIGSGSGKGVNVYKAQICNMGHKQIQTISMVLQFNSREVVRKKAFGGLKMNISLRIPSLGLC